MAEVMECPHLHCAIHQSQVPQTQIFPTPGTFKSFNQTLELCSSELYKLLDEKDEEIHVVTRLNEQLKGKFDS